MTAMGKVVGCECDRRLRFGIHAESDVARIWVVNVHLLGWLRHGAKRAGGVGFLLVKCGRTRGMTLASSSASYPARRLTFTSTPCDYCPNSSFINLHPNAGMTVMQNAHAFDISSFTMLRSAINGKERTFVYNLGSQQSPMRAFVR